MNDKPSRKCPRCGMELATSFPNGVCPRCAAALLEATPTEPMAGGKHFIPPTPDELAAKFPQLEILSFLGQGGMGAVYKARQRQLDRVIALKILPPAIGVAPGFAERFAREAKAMAKLNHPGIVTIHDFGRADGLFYLLMEFVDGVTLGELIRHGRVSSREALAIVPQICDALQYAHDQGIVHRDIKPENILLDRRGRVKVADFGLAKLMEQSPELAARGADIAAGPVKLTNVGKVMGTPQYMAPEQVEHPAEVDHRADIYALGVVFYQMLTGELPGKPIEPPSSRVQVDVRLDEVVLRALQQKPELRYQQASEIKTQVETIATSGGGGAVPVNSSITRNLSWKDRLLFGFFSNQSLPIHIQEGGRRHLYWPGVLLQCSLLGLTIIPVILVTLLVMGWLFNVPREKLFGSADLWPTELELVFVWVALSIVMRLAALNLGSTEMMRARAAQAAKVSAARKLLVVSFAVILGVGAASLFGWAGRRLSLWFSGSIKSDYIGQTWFPQGDAIAITSVERTRNQMTVKGRYNLVSHDQATLALYISSTNLVNFPEDPKETLRISKGGGAFELSRSHLVAGLPHVSMYAEGRSFAALYFGTKAQAREESQASWITNAAAVSPRGASPENLGGKTIGMLRLNGLGVFNYKNTVVVFMKSEIGYPLHEIVAHFAGPPLTQDERLAAHGINAVSGPTLDPSPYAAMEGGPDQSIAWCAGPNECQLQFALPDEEQGKQAVRQMQAVLTKPLPLHFGEVIPLFRVGERKAWLEVREMRPPIGQLAFIQTDIRYAADGPVAGRSPVSPIGTNHAESAVVTIPPNSMLALTGTVYWMLPNLTNVANACVPGPMTNLFSTTLTNDSSQPGLYWLTWRSGSTNSKDGFEFFIHDGRTTRELHHYVSYQPMKFKWRADWWYRSSTVGPGQTMTECLLIDDGLTKPISNAHIPYAVFDIAMTMQPVLQNKPQEPLLAPNSPQDRPPAR